MLVYSIRWYILSRPNLLNDNHGITLMIIKKDIISVVPITHEISVTFSHLLSYRSNYVLTNKMKICIFRLGQLILIVGEVLYVKSHVVNKWFRFHL